MNKKKNENARKLRLNKLRVRDLTPSDLSNVAGGVTDNGNCFSCTCPRKPVLVEA